MKSGLRYWMDLLKEAVLEIGVTLEMLTSHVLVGGRAQTRIVRISVGVLMMVLAILDVYRLAAGMVLPEGRSGEIFALVATALLGSIVIWVNLDSRFRR